MHSLQLLACLYQATHTSLLVRLQLPQAPHEHSPLVALAPTLVTAVVVADISIDSQFTEKNEFGPYT